MLKDALSIARMVTIPHAQSPFNAHWVPFIFVQMGHQLVPGGVVVGPVPGWRSRDVGEVSMGSILVDFAPSISGVAPIYGRAIK
jgi:hypothetical protein